jgi:hypothetical protein
LFQNVRIFVAPAGAAAVRAGLALDPRSTIRRFRDATSAWHDNPTSLAGRDRTIEGMRMAEVPED